jgi:hypothetical protein
MDAWLRYQNRLSPALHPPLPMSVMLRPEGQLPDPNATRLRDRLARALLDACSPLIRSDDSS